jgi:hypothetical protein
MPDYLETRLKNFHLVSLLALFSSAICLAGGSFPASPDPKLTPGSLCEKQSELRYPERIKYCNRHVSSSTKYDIIDTYDQILGYSIGDMPRGQFKIDHYIPLCMGGSNERDNLWPQHESVYRFTDRLEQVACERMAQGKLLQADAIALIRRAKADPAQAPAITEDLLKH